MMTRIAAIFVVLFLATSHPPRAQEQTAAATPAVEIKVPSNPREAGARYGQAAGVALLCYGMRTTGAAEVLKSKYQGEALAAFTDQAERILGMWKDTLSCKHAGGPNQCRLSHAYSCAEAMKEIGPNGSKLAGLVEERPAGDKAAAAPDEISVSP
ncbi:MAG: hypothetical protein ABL894_04065 [Hyphomicrobium sp.]